MNDAPKNNPLTADQQHELESKVPFLKLLGLMVDDVGDGRIAFRMTVEERHLRTLGIVHGGVTATLLDTATGCAASTKAPADHHVVTVQLNVNFIRPAWQGETLIASGEVKHAGRQTAVASGEVRTDEGVLVATAMGTFMFLPHPKDAAKMEKHDD